MKRALLVVVAVACGHRVMPMEDAGVEDSGVPDAGQMMLGRVKGNDPPVNWSLALAQPGDAGATSRWGVSAAMALDQFSQPMIAAIVVDPNGDGVFQDNRVVFTRWNGADGGFWQDPVTIATVGDIDVSHPNRQVSMSRDSTSGKIGVAFINDMGAVRFAHSEDEGEHWSQETLSGGRPSTSNPVIELSQGHLDVAYVTPDAVITRRFDDAGTGQDVSRAASPWPIAMHDGTVAYFSGDDAGVILYLEGDPVAISAIPVDSPAMIPSVSTDGTSLAFHLRSDTSAVTQLWHARKVAGNWQVTGLPRNGPSGMEDGTKWYQAVTFDGSKLAVVGNFDSRTATTAIMCGGPKLGRSTDGLSWTVCHPPESAGPLAHVFNFAGQWINMASHKPGKLTIAFYNDSRFNPQIGAGVVVYREP
jgi:hypothetical protein